MKNYPLHCMVPTLIEKNSGRITIQEGSNNIRPKHTKSKETARDVSNCGNICRTAC